MNSLFRICAVVLLSGEVFLPAQNVPGGQNPPSVTMVPFSEAGVTVQPYDPTLSPVVAKFIQDNPELARLIPYSAVLSNASGKSIVGLTTRWTRFTALGPVPDTLRQDSLFLSATPVVRPGSKLLITPSQSWSEEVIGLTSDLSGGLSVKSVAQRFESSSAVTLEIDTVIFEDGLVIGPDRSQTADFIRARKDVSESLARTALQVLDSGGDLANVLTPIGKPGGGLNDPVGLWRERIANLLMRAPNARSVAEQLLNLPQITNLHR